MTVSEALFKVNTNGSRTNASFYYKNLKARY